jgi:Carbonic anhydrase
VTGERHPDYTAQEALDRLKQGNQRFVDSRVPPELLFDAGFGELFIVRVAGNVYDFATGRVRFLE